MFLCFSVFQSNDVLLTVSLAGKLSKHRLAIESDGTRTLNTIWTNNTSKVLKTNTLKVSSSSNGYSWIVVGGVGEGGRGFIEVWEDREG